MGTTLEGDIAQALDVVIQAHNAVKALGANRVQTQINIDDRVPALTIEEEVGAYRI